MCAAGLKNWLTDCKLPGTSTVPHLWMLQCSLKPSFQGLMPARPKLCFNADQAGLSRPVVLSTNRYCPKSHSMFGSIPLFLRSMGYMSRSNAATDSEQKSTGTGIT